MNAKLIEKKFLHSEVHPVSDDTVYVYVYKKLQDTWQHNIASNSTGIILRIGSPILQDFCFENSYNQTG